MVHCYLIKSYSCHLLIKFSLVQIRCADTQNEDTQTGILVLFWNVRVTGVEGECTEDEARSR